MGSLSLSSGKHIDLMSNVDTKLKSSSIAMVSHEENAGHYIPRHQFQQTTQPEGNLLYLKLEM